MLVKGELGKINNKQKDALITINRNCDRLRQHVSALLYASEDCSQNVTYNFEDADIISLLDKVLKPGCYPLKIKIKEQFNPVLQNISLQAEMYPQV